MRTFPSAHKFQPKAHGVSDQTYPLRLICNSVFCITALKERGVDIVSASGDDNRWVTIPVPPSPSQSHYSGYSTTGSSSSMTTVNYGIGDYGTRQSHQSPWDVSSIHTVGVANDESMMIPDDVRRRWYHTIHTTSAIREQKRRATILPHDDGSRSLVGYACRSTPVSVEHTPSGSWGDCLDIINDGDTAGSSSPRSRRSTVVCRSQPDVSPSNDREDQVTHL